MLMPAWFSEWRPLSDHWDLTYATANIALHAALLVIHLLLAIDLSYHLEHRISAVAGLHARILSLSTTAVSQLIALIFTAVLVVMTQQLALRRDLYDRATATVLHDKSSAWLGLMSSLLAIYHQTRLRTAAVPIMLVFLYLAGITVIHTTTPILFSNVNALLPLDVANEWGLEPESQVLSASVVPARFSPNKTLLATDAIFQHFPLVVPRDSGPSLVFMPAGIWGSTLYDTPPKNLIFDQDKYEGHIEIGKISVRHTCGVVREAVVLNSTDEGYVTIDMSPTFGTMVVSLTNPAKRHPVAIARAVPFNSNQEDGSAPSVTNPELPWIVVMAAFSHTYCPSLGVSCAHPFTFHISNRSMHDPLIFACSLSVIDGKAISRNPARIDLNMDEEDLVPVYPDSFYYVAKQDLSDDDYADWLVSLIPTSQHQHGRCQSPVGTSQHEACLGHAAFEDKLVPCSLMSGFTLSTLATCLQHQTVIMAWVGGWVAPYMFGQTPTEQYITPITWFSKTAMLQLNALPVYIGLVTSAVLLVLAFLLTWPRRQSKGIHKNLNAPGVLQIIWLLGRGAQKANDIAKLNPPHTRDLREKGLQVVLGEPNQNAVDQDGSNVAVSGPQPEDGIEMQTMARSPE